MKRLSASSSSAAAAAAAPAARVAVPAAAASTAAASTAPTGFDASLILAFQPRASDFPVELKRDFTLLMDGPHALLRDNTKALECFIMEEKRTGNKPDDVLFTVADSSLQHLHTICALLQRVCALKLRAGTLRIALLSAIALEQTAVSLLLRPTTLHPSTSAPSLQPLIWAGKSTRVELVYCSSFEKALALPNLRVLFIPSVSEYLGVVATREQQEKLVVQLLQSMPCAQLFPPLSWQELTCRKNAVYAVFTEKHMLHTVWIPLHDKDSLPRVAAQICAHCRRGKWILKGNFSACSQATFTATFVNQRCSDLLHTLEQLFTRHHQRYVGVQRFEQSLRDCEMRVYLIPDEQHHLRWRQTVSLATVALSDENSSHLAENSTYNAELQLALHGRPLQIARFIDGLLQEHADYFLRAEMLHFPLLRLDCGFDREGKPFLNELVGAVNCGCFSGAHCQDLAFVVGQGLADGLMAAMMA